MKKGFTMIELIFVIVIIGILAAVAIPKLAATRDDAKIATAASEVATAVSDIGTYYTAQGKFGTISDMTNVKFGANGNDNNMTAGAYYQAGGDDCIQFTTTTTDGNLTLTDNNATGLSSICTGLQTAVKDLNGTHQFGGSSVKFN